MTIVCPHCMTSYAIDPSGFGAAGRRVRCARCQEIWLVMPQDNLETADAMSAMRAARRDVEYDIDQGEWREKDPPHIESPSISADLPETGATDGLLPDLQAEAGKPGESQGRRKGRARRLAPGLRSSTWNRALPSTATISPILCVGFAALLLALFAWRTELVRLMPQTAGFYKMAGMGVNLRGIEFSNMKISTEIVDDKHVLLIEGEMEDVARRPVDIPRLRFTVRDAKGHELYAWNAVLQQTVIEPGDKIRFKTRLASPPPEGREISVRFFNQLDLASGGA